MKTPPKTRPEKVAAMLTRTPTPFKNAMAEVGKRRSGSYVPPSPNGLNEDISELMQKEEDSVSEINEAEKREGDADYKENEQPAKKVKTFDNSWESSDISFLAETPVRLLNIFSFLNS